MARNNNRERTQKRAPRDSRPKGRRRVCVFCKEHAVWVDYKDVNLLRRFMSDRGKIRARRVTGNCAQHQRDVQVAIKTARELALLPYTQRTLSDRGARAALRSAPDAEEGYEEGQAYAGAEDDDELEDRPDVPVGMEDTFESDEPGPEAPGSGDPGVGGAGRDNDASSETVEDERPEA